jgi:hypothetical protein
VRSEKGERSVMENNIDKKEVITQESLQPQRIPNGTGPYKSVLDIVERLKKMDATNIALTGPYGSGKSSILITLKEDFPAHHYLDISLATLRPLQEKDSEKNNNEVSNGNGEVETKEQEHEGREPAKQDIDRLIEYSILQQLIYREKQETLQNSRLKRIFHLSQKKVKYITITTLFALLALVIVFEPSVLRVEWMCKLFGHKWLNILFDSLSLAYLTIYAYGAMKMIIPALSNSRLNKLNIKNGEIEIVKNTSIFNKHLDEILYFFEQTDYDVVILEDLDRFESTDIFLKLRELNLLLNESKVITRKIFFIYAVRDDMFKDADRVKCFDYITTVIPIINRSNAKSLLKEELEKRGVKEIADVYLRELGFFLHDMRLLKNIANEYVQYREKISKGISCEKLLGMIVYKNYFPNDFADLHDCKGKVYNLLNLKDNFVAKRIEDLEADAERKRELRLSHEKDRHLKVSELRRIYIEAYRDRLPRSTQEIRVGDNYYSFSDVAQNGNLFDKLITTPNIEYHYIVSNGNYNAGRLQSGSANIPFEDLQNEVNKEKSYRERLNAVNATYDDFEEKEEVEIRKEDVRSQPLSKIMSEVEYESNPDYAALEIPKLIEFLIVKGYVDENYYDYISYFYDNFIDPHDWEFVLDLKLWKSHPYDYQVNSVEACLKEIPNNVYRKNAILNTDIVDYLAANVSERLNQMRLTVVLRTAVEGKKYDFFAAYYLKGKQQDVVFEQLFSQHKNLWKVFEKNDDEKQSLKQCWFKYAEKEQSCSDSRKWLSEHFDFLIENLLDISEEQWIQLIRECDYKFKNLNGKSGVILDAIAEKNAYLLTRHNVETLVARFLNMKIDSVSYRLINETGHEELINRVEDNLGECLKSVFAVPEAEKEDKDSILGIILSHEATEEEKIAYLSKQQNKIELDVIEQKSDIILAMKCDVVAATWENVIHYMNNVSEQKPDDVLTTFIEMHADELAEIAVPQESEDNERMLLRQYIKSDILSFGTYRKILNQFTRWNFTGVPSIEERRVLLLIEKNTIRFKEENTTNMLNNYSGPAVVSYLIKNKRDFLSKPETVAYTTEVAIELMRSSLSIREKAMIIPCFEESILNKELANEVISVMKFREINLEVSFLVNAMILSDKTDDKIMALGNVLEKTNLDEAVITSIISSLPGKYKEMAEKGKKPELPDTPETKRLVKILKVKDYISSYSESKNGIRVNTKLK